MAYIFRLILKKLTYLFAGLIFATLISFCNDSKADYPTTVVYNSNGVTYSSDQIIQACIYRHSVTGDKSNPTITYNLDNSKNAQCLINGVHTYTLLAYHSCPFGGNRVGNFCSGNINCPPPLVPNSAGTTCENPPGPCLSKANTSQSYFTPGVSSSACLSGCKIYRDTGYCGNNTAGQTGCFWQGTFDGTTCTETTFIEPTNTPEYDCIKQGKSYGEVNGQIVCLPKSTPGAPPVTSTDKTEKTETDSNGDTKITTKTTTKNPDGTITTSTTTITNGGNPQTTEKTEPQKSFCEENPQSKICKDDEQSQFSGSCDNFFCDGDAIQCAIAKKQHQSRCDDTKEGDITDKGNAILNGTDDFSPQAILEQETFISIPTDLDYDSFFPETCPSDLTIPFGQSAVTLPFSKLCGGFQLMGELIMIFAYLTAFRIVARAF